MKGGRLNSVPLFYGSSGNSETLSQCPAFSDTVCRFAVYRDRAPFIEPVGSWQLAVTVIGSYRERQSDTENGRGQRSTVNGHRKRPA
jgi:hypothetical protein